MMHNGMHFFQVYLLCHLAAGKWTLFRKLEQLVHPGESFSDFKEMWYVDRGPWVMHDGMPYDPIQGQGQGHEYLKATQEELTVSPARD